MASTRWPSRCHVRDASMTRPLACLVGDITRGLLLQLQKGKSPGDKKSPLRSPKWGGGGGSGGAAVTSAELQLKNRELAQNIAVLEAEKDKLVKNLSREASERARVLPVLVVALFLLVELVCGVLGSDPAARWEAAMRHSLLAAGAAALPKLIDRVILVGEHAKAKSE